MKKVFAYLLVILMALSFVSCKQDDNKETSKNNNDTVQSSETNNKTNEKTNSKNSKILIAYFSATNTTKGVAKKLSAITGGELYEITPKDPYTSDDLDYNNDNSRTSLEMNDSSARPEISGQVKNFEQYDIVFVGYPIWWGEAPRILSTFMESYDFSNKTVIPFCTSASSDIGSSASPLEKLTKGAKWLDGKRFDANTSDSELKDFVSDLNLK